jgi:hypothetical protein
MIRPLALAASAAALLAVLPAHAQGKIEPGEWEQKMTIEHPGMPGGPMEQVVRQCITSGDAAIFSDKDRWAQEMVSANPEAQCKIQSSKQEGTALSVTLACKDDVILKVRHDYKGETGVIDAETLIAGAPQGKNHIESRKVADACGPESIEQWKRQNPGKTFAP